MTTSVRGATAEERAAARARRTRERRAAYYVDLMRSARTAIERLGHACAFARAVANDLADEAVNDLAFVIARHADERNQP